MIQKTTRNIFLQGKRLLTLTAVLFWVTALFAQSSNCRSNFKFEVNHNTKTVTLKAESSHSPAVFGFDLGDGNFSRGQEISHTYSATGDYKVCLTTIAFDSATNKRCTTNICKKVQIVDCDRLKADFRYVVDGNTVKLIGETNSNNVSTGFRFGDGQGERKDSVKHTYAKPGIYEVCYIAQDLTYGCRKEVCKKIIISAPCDLEAKFEYRQEDNDFKFAAKANDRPARFLWSFGDGTRASGDEVKHEYDEAGTYEVCLVVYALNATNDQVCTTKVCKRVIVKEDNDCKLRAKFDFRQDDNLFKFYAKANQTPARFNWNFGDGNTGTGENVRHEYDKPGVYRVCVTVITKGDKPGEVCKTTYCKKVEVKRPECTLKADYAFELEGKKLKLKARANGDSLHYFWAFGDGEDATGKVTRHKFDKPGKYEVCLIVFDPATKCKVCVCKTIIVEKPCRLKGDFILRQADEKIAVKARSNGSKLAKYYWDFGDGTTATRKKARHTYTKKGVYIVTLWIADRRAGCKIEIQKRVAVGVRFTADSKTLLDDVQESEAVQAEEIILPTWDAKVTPSPARSTVQITSEEKVLAKVQIFGVDGAMAIESEKDLKNIDISALLPGFYYAHVYAEDGTKTVVKFLKN
jgi:PKD repeat protein